MGLTRVLRAWLEGPCELGLITQVVILQRKWKAIPCLCRGKTRGRSIPSGKKWPNWSKRRRSQKKPSQILKAEVYWGVSIICWECSRWSEGSWLAVWVTCFHELPDSRIKGESPHMGWLKLVRGNVRVTLIGGGTCCVIRPRLRPQYSHKSRSGCLKTSGSVKETWSGWPVGLGCYSLQEFRWLMMWINKCLNFS